MEEMQAVAAGDVYFEEDEKQAGAEIDLLSRNDCKGLECRNCLLKR